MVRIAFSGSRYRSEEALIRQLMEVFDAEETFIVHGDCPMGIDHEVSILASRLNLKQKKFPPKSGLSKDLLARNVLIAKNSDILFALPSSHENGHLALMGIVTRGGTEHTIRQFIRLGKPVILC